MLIPSHVETVDRLTSSLGSSHFIWWDGRPQAHAEEWANQTRRVFHLTRGATARITPLDMRDTRRRDEPGEGDKEEERERQGGEGAGTLSLTQVGISSGTLRTTQEEPGGQEGGKGGEGRD